MRCGFFRCIQVFQIKVSLNLLFLVNVLCSRLSGSKSFSGHSQWQLVNRRFPFRKKKNSKIHSLDRLDFYEYASESRSFLVNWPKKRHIQHQLARTLNINTVFIKLFWNHYIFINLANSPVIYLVIDLGTNNTDQMKLSNHAEEWRLSFCAMWFFWNNGKPSKCIHLALLHGVFRPHTHNVILVHSNTKVYFF